MALTIDINTNCCLNCEFCYQSDIGCSLSKKRILEIISDNDGFETVEIGGGEPLMHYEIVEILTGIHEKKKKAIVATNAVRVPQELLRLDSEVKRNTQMQISLNASNPELYKAISGYDFFDSVLRNTQALSSEFPCSLSTVAYKRNLEDIPNIITLADSLQLPIRINLAFPLGRGKNIELLTASEVNSLRGYLLEMKVRRPELIDSPLIHRQNNCLALERVYGLKKEGKCPLDLGTKKYYSPSGEVYSCEMLGRAGEENGSKR